MSGVRKRHHRAVVVDLHRIEESGGRLAGTDFDEFVMNSLNGLVHAVIRVLQNVLHGRQ